MEILNLEKKNVDELVSYGNSQTSTTTTGSDIKPAKDSVGGLMSWISGQSEDVTVGANTTNIPGEIQSAINSQTYTATVHVSTSGAIHGGQGGSFGSNAYGTLSNARAYGSAFNVANLIPAYANGTDVAIKKDEKALVNEFGNEGLIRNGKLYTIPGGMHYQSLKKGDIVLSVKQMHQLELTGKASGHARAYASGTLPNGSLLNAYNDGTGNGGIKFEGGASGKTINSTASATAKTVANAAEKSSGAIEKATESAKDLFDWIQIRLEKLQRKTDNYIRKAENASLVSRKLNNYNKAISSIDDQITANKAGAKRYQKQANSVGLSSSLAKKVRNGTIDINQYDEATQEKINQYKQWYDLVVDCKQAVKELTDQQKELARTKIDTIVEKYDLLANYAGSRVSRNDAHLTYRETAGYSNINSTQKSIYRDNIAMEQYTLQKNQTLANKLRNEIAYQLANGEMKLYDDAWRDAQIKLREFDEAVYSSKTAIEEMQQEIRNVETTKLQRALDAVKRWADQLGQILNLKEARGQNVTEADYKKQIVTNNDEILILEDLIYDSQEKQKNYEAGSEKWEEEAKIQADYQNQIMEKLISNEEYLNKIFADRWEEFEKYNDGVEDALTDIEHIRGNLDSSLDENGNITDDGYTNIVLIGKAIELSQQKVTDYNAALDKLEKQYKNGLISEDEYLEKQREYQSVIRDSISSVEDYKDELVDLWVNQAEKRNEVLQEEIDLRKKALSEKKEYHDYDKKLKNQTKELNLLEAQIKALEGVGDAASKAKAAKLKAQAEEARESLQETRDEHEYDLAIKGYDTLATDLQDQLDLTLEKLEYNSDIQQTVVNEMLDGIKTEYNTAYSEINSIIENTGLAISSSTATAISNLKSVSAELANINNYTASTAANSINTAGVDTTKASNGQSTATAERLATTKLGTANGATNKDASNTGTTSGKAQSVKLKKSSVSITKGSSTTLGVTITPTNASTKLAWSSDNSKIATVSGGKVTAKKKGTAIITVKDEVSGLSDTCTVKVTAKKAKNNNKNKATDTNVPTVNLKTGEITYPDTKESNTSSGSSNIWKGISKDASRKGDKTLDLSNSIVDRMKYNGYKSDNSARTQLWKNLNGSGAYSGTANQNSWMLQKLKKAGYASGGVVRDYIPIDTLTLLGSSVMKNGDSGFITINPGEYVLPEDLAKGMKPALNIMTDFTEAYNNAALSGAAPSITIDSLITVNGNVDKNVMDDLTSFGKQLAANQAFMNSIAKNIDKQMTADAYKAGFVRKIR